MPNSIDFDKLSDEDVMNILEDIDSIDDVEPEGNIEDTDHTEDPEPEDETETETNEGDDDFSQDTDEDETEGEETEDGENSQEDVDEESENSEGEEGEEPKGETELTPEEEKELESNTDGMTKQEKIDYKKAYEEALAEKEQYEDFYKQATSEFVANGKVMKGFNDPKKIIQAQQMAAGFSEKMKAFKKYRPFINPLKEKGMLENPDKFNLMLNALDGDKEAIKKIIQEAEIDPTELDMENVNYKANNHISTDIEVAFDDVIDTASQYGVRDRVEQVVAKDWDDDSVIELLEDPQNSADLINHLSTGVYDLVQERISQKKISDPYGAYANKRAIDQYREAANELENELIQQLQAQEAATQDNTSIQNQAEQSQQFSEDEIQAEIERIRKERVYTEKVKQKNAEADKGRKKAASVSKRKTRTRKKETEFDPGKMSDEEFTSYLDSLVFQNK